MYYWDILLVFHLYPRVNSSCICCISLCLIVSHRLENGIWPNIHTRRRLVCVCLCCPEIVCTGAAQADREQYQGGAHRKSGRMDSLARFTERTVASRMPYSKAFALTWYHAITWYPPPLEPPAHTVRALESCWHAEEGLPCCPVTSRGSSVTARRSKWSCWRRVPS